MLVPEETPLYKYPPLFAPFDSLLSPYISHSSRLYLARRAASHIQQHVSNHHPSPIPNPRRVTDGILRIGFISFDINNHPTSHLLEAVFIEIQASLGLGANSKSVFSQVQLYVYAYGRDDNSTYRKHLEEVCVYKYILYTVFAIYYTSRWLISSWIWHIWIIKKVLLRFNQMELMC